MAEQVFSPSHTIRDTRVHAGGVEFTTRLKTACLANILMGSATRILMRIASFRAESFRRLEAQIHAIDWELCLPPRCLPDIRVTTHKSRLYHSTAIAERIRPIVRDRLFSEDGSRYHTAAAPGVHPENPPGNPLKSPMPQTLIVRGMDDRFELSLDMSGLPLYKRGVKENSGRAPLRETLAFAMLTRLHLSEKEMLVDPMCGSGTFSLEGAMMQCALPPGIFRSFAFEAWPGFEEKSMAHARSRLMAATGVCMETGRWSESGESPGVSLPPILARDRDQSAIDRLKQTCMRHPVFDRISPLCDDFFTMTPPPVKGIVVLNPPYGIRLSSDQGQNRSRTRQQRHSGRHRTGSDDVTALYREIGQKLATDFKGWRAGVICPDRKSRQALNLGLPTMPLFHGGLDLHTAIGIIGR